MYRQIDILLAIVFGIVFFSLGCENTDATLEKLMRVSDEGVEIGTDVDIYYSDSSGPQVRIQAATLERHLVSNKVMDIFPDGVYVEFFGDSNVVESTLRGDYAVRNEAENLVTVQDSVVLESEDGRKIFTSELNWNEKEQEIYTNRAAKIIQGDEQIYTIGLRADQSFKNYEFLQVVGRTKTATFNE